MPSLLFSPFSCRSVVMKNRVGVAPMCQYSAQGGMPNAWHVVHLGSRAVGGAGLVMVEAAAVAPDGRITSADIGIWTQEQADAFRPITDFAKEQGAVPGIQLAHAGRKGSTQVPWEGRKMVSEESGGWETIAPSAVRFNEEYPLPREMTEADMERVIDHYVQAAKRSASACFEVLELHMGHGYLLHQFLSPLANRRAGDYGGGFDQRTAFPLRLIEAVRGEWPAHLPLFVRLSAVDWVDGGWDLDQSIQFARALRARGVDLIDCSSGSILPSARGKAVPNFQVPFAAEIRQRAGIATAAVGLITEAQQAEEILASGQADLIFVGRKALAEPYWPLRAQQELEGKANWPIQYDRAVNPNALV
ncbi:NADH:flavin oxidoreductase/NADH oxidase [Parapusillimonas sp. SGNA-6]|nr:NADH:flavin oxidoreductase/NADH oxidase [Parapusillimonas sp. SGNA-6]